MERHGQRWLPTVSSELPAAAVRSPAVLEGKLAAEYLQ